MRINALSGRRPSLPAPINLRSEVMTKCAAATAILLVALAIGTATATPVSAEQGPAGPGMMGQGYYGMGPGMMAPGQPPWTMGPGMMAPGYGTGPGQQPWMMGPGHGMGPGMMGQGYEHPVGPGMGQGYGMGYGRQPWSGARVTPTMHLTTDDVRTFFQRQLAAQGNERLKVGKVEALDDDTIQAQIVTVDDSLVETHNVDRHTGAVSPAG
jgi:hypothetical protein